MTEAPVYRFKEIKDALGGTVNDVVLTAVAGGLHKLLRAHKEPTRDRRLRAMVPVSVRSDAEKMALALHLYAELGDDPRDLVGLKRPRRDKELHAFVSVSLAFRSDRRRCHRQGSTRLKRRVRDAPHMPELREDAPARLVHAVGDGSPALDLLLRPDAGRMRVAGPSRRLC